MENNIVEAHTAEPAAPLGTTAAVRLVCKGAWELGTACGRCHRCLEAAPAEIARLQGLVKSANLDADMYAKAWQRELGRWMAPKHHHIDACVVGTRNLIAAEKALRPWVDGLRRWKTDSSDARTLGLPEPGLADYLPKLEAA